VRKIVLLALIVTLAVAGCSGDGDGDAGDAGAPTDRTPTAEATLAETVPEQQPGLAEDNNDVGGPLDLEHVSAVRTGDLLAVSITTYERWDDDVLTGPRFDRQGPNRMTVLYDVDLDGRTDYTGKIVFAEGALSLVLAGESQAFEPVPVERPDDATAQFVHPVDVFFVVLNDSEGGGDFQIAVETEAVGFQDRIPAEGWLPAAVGPS
jgi:hypothetical protein